MKTRTLVQAMLFLATNQLLDGGMVTSMEKIQELAHRRDHHDVIIRQALEQAIKSETEKLNDLTSMLTGHFKTPGSTLGGSKGQLSHPNDMYLLIKHYVSLSGRSGISGQIVEGLLKQENVSLPSREDLQGARASLLRLQRVYGLNVHDMHAGNYTGCLGSPLQPDDAYVIGSTAFQQGDVKEATEWLELAVDKLTPLTNNDDASTTTTSTTNSKDSSEGLPLSSNESLNLKTVALLGRAYFYDNQTKLAAKMYETCKSFRGVTVSDVLVLGQELALTAVDQRAKQSSYRAIFKPIDSNMSALCCRDKDHRVSLVLPSHVCRLKADVYIPYIRFKEEVLSTSPYVSLFYDVIHDAEIQHLKGLVKNNLKRGKIVASFNRHVESNDRTGELAWVGDEDKVAARVSQRVKAITRLEVKQSTKSRPGSSESFQVVNYGLGGHYDVHMDAMLLSDVEKGGSTVFPRTGISVAPIKGMALFWYNFEPAMGSRDEMTYHAACPVVVGNKWIANKWIWTYGNTFRRPCGLSPESRQLDVEKIVSSASVPNY